MTRIALTRFSLSLPALLLAQTAFADVTAAQVWGDWKTYMQSMGYTMSATETANGDDLTVSDITMLIEIPEGEGTATMTMGSMTFQQDGGAVNILIPDVMPIVVDISPVGGADPVKLSMSYTQSGQVMRASGSPEEMTYDYSADSIAVNLDELIADGETFGEENAKINVVGTGVSSTTKMTIGSLRSYVQSGAIASMTYDVNIDNPQEAVKIKATGGIQGVAFDGGGAIPMNIDYADMAAMLKAGFAVDGTFSYTGGNSQMNVTDPENGNFAATTSSAGGALGVKMGAQTLAYDVTQNDVKVNVQVATLPFPVDLSMAKSAFKLAMPISASDAPQDFAFGLTMADFEMSDLIWSLFDPTSQLPRDPATIEMDLSGKATMLVDIMDPEATANADVPGELQTLTLDKVLVDAVGAKLEGSGDFAFDNSDTTTYDGMPKPVGAINVDLAGANGLLDKLVAMGLLPEQQAMGARMMMGLFAVPGDGPDTLKSKVEFNEEGQILANGQRIK